jgi:phosphotransferase system enzyme I (PtsI)
MIIKGISASPGIAIGKVVTLSDIVRYETYKIKTSEIKKELIRLEVAILSSKKQLQLLAESSAEEMPDDSANVFMTHMQYLEDPLLLHDIIQKIHDEPLNIETIIDNVFSSFIKKFTSLTDSYMKERAIDLVDVRDRLLKNLLGIPPENQNSCDCIKNSSNEKCIILAKSITPSQLVDMDKNKIAGIAIEEGGATSHVVLFARSIELPTLVGVHGLMESAKDGDTVILDSMTGNIHTQVSKKEIQKFNDLKTALIQEKDSLKLFKNLKGITRDKKRITLGMNISLPQEAGLTKSFGADMIGLFRTEFLFMDKPSLPTEEEQFEAYKNVAVACKGQVVIRTMDIGGDKNLPYLQFPTEENPFLGLRASAYGDLKIIYPMISRVQEFDKCRKILKDVMKDLKSGNLPFDPNIQQGVLIEVPAAVEIIDLLSKKADFFSIGTNDLIQFTLGVDRTNEHISNLYDPFHPAIIRILDRIIKESSKYNIPVSICGEMAGNPLAAILLIGLGMSNLSMNGPAIPVIKKLIRNVSFEQVKTLSLKILKMDDPAKIKKQLNIFLKSINEN